MKRVFVFDLEQTALKIESAELLISCFGRLKISDYITPEKRVEVMFKTRCKQVD